MSRNDFVPAGFFPKNVTPNPSITPRRVCHCVFLPFFPQLTYYYNVWTTKRRPENLVDHTSSVARPYDAYTVHILSYRVGGITWSSVVGLTTLCYSRKAHEFTPYITSPWQLIMISISSGFNITYIHIKRGFFVYAQTTVFFSFPRVLPVHYLLSLWFVVTTESFIRMDRVRSVITIIIIAESRCVLFYMI